MTSDRNQGVRARGPRIAAGWLGIAAFALFAAGLAAANPELQGYPLCLSPTSVSVMLTFE